MGTGLSWDFAATSDRGMLQRAQDGLAKRDSKTPSDLSDGLVPNNRLRKPQEFSLHQLGPRRNGGPEPPGPLKT